MSNQLQTFINEQFGEVRTLLIENEPWFVGKDVATCLGYTDTDQAIRNHVDEEDKQLIQNRRIDGLAIPNRGLTIINESGLYSLIFSSELSSARTFKHWVTSEVLPSLRKTGQYKIPQPGMHEMKLICERSKLQHEALEMKPKADYYDDIVDSDGLMTMDVAAKALHIKGIGRTKLFALLRQMKILNRHNIPYQEYINRDLFEVKQKVIEYPGGIAKKVTLVTLVTPKGLQYIKKKLNNK